MEITELHAYKGNTWLLRMDGSESPYFLHVSVVQKFHLQEGMRLPESAWEQVQTAELSRKAFQHACYLLDRRDYSYQEMYRKLEPKYPAAVCYAVTDRLAAKGLISDRRYAEQLARHYVTESTSGCAVPGRRCTGTGCWRRRFRRRWNRIRNRWRSSFRR